MINLVLIPENENVKTPCRIFVKPLWARNEEHEISRHHVQYHAYGAKYSYSFTTVTCSTPSVRKLDMFILCEGETGMLIPLVKALSQHLFNI